MVMLPQAIAMLLLFWEGLTIYLTLLCCAATWLTSIHD